MKDNATKKVIEHAIDMVDDWIHWESEIPADEVHHKMFNEDYFIIGYARAEEFLKEYGIFQAMEEIKQYEMDNFGEVTTDLSDSEKVSNMFAYIKGEEILNECDTLTNTRFDGDTVLTQSDLRTLKEELEAQL